MLIFYASLRRSHWGKKVTWYRRTIRNFEVVDSGKDTYFLQGDNLHLIGEILKEWLTRLPPFTSPAICSC